MLIPRIVRGGPDKIFAIVRNTEAATNMIDGEVVTWSVAVTANWGSDIVRSVSLGQLTVAGVISGKTIVPGDFGFCQVYGFHNNVKTTAAAQAAGTTAVSDAAAAAGNGGTGDDPSSRLGVYLRLGSGNIAGLFIKAMG